VKEVIRQLRLDGHSGEYEDKAYDRINVLICKVSEVTNPCGEAGLRCAVFNHFLVKIYKRTK